METEVIKELLSCYRPELVSGDDPADDEMREALDAVSQDPALAEWLEGEQAFDRAFARKVLSHAVPPGLREGIMARLQEVSAYSEAGAAGSIAGQDPELRAGEAPDATLIDRSASFGKSGSTAPASRSLFPVYGWLAAAAAIAISLIAIFGFGDDPPSSQDTAHSLLANFRKDMSKIAREGTYGNGFQRAGFKESKDWLQNRKAPVFKTLPPDLAKYEGMGCNVIQWGESKVSLVCFKPGSSVVHLFVLRRNVLKDASSSAEPIDKVFVHHELENAGWMDDENVYLCVGADPNVKVGPLLPK